MVKLSLLLVLFGFGVCIAAPKKTKAKEKATNMEPENLTTKYAKLFVGKKYTKPMISLEPLGKTQWADGVELIKVLNYPPPPADPVPYDLWVVVNGNHLFEKSDINSIYKKMNPVIKTEADALKVAQTLIYIASAHAYYHVDMLNTEKNSIAFKNNEWIVKQLTVSAPTQNALFDDVQRMQFYEITLSKDTCKIK